MNPTPFRRYLPWALFGVTVGFFLAGIVFPFLAPNTSGATQWGSGGFLSQILFEVAMFSFPVAGIVIAARDPNNTIGLLFLGIGLAWGIDGFLSSYYTYGLQVQSLPGDSVALAIDEIMWVPAIGLTGVFLLLLFPTGRLPSPGWKLFARVAGAVMIVGPLGVFFAPGAFADSGYPDVPNPLGIEAVGGMLRWLSFAMYLLPIFIIGAVIALVRRFRRSSGVERVQMKWIVAAAGVVGFLFPLAILVSVVTGQSDLTAVPGFVVAIQNLSLFSLVLIPTAAGIAILRHRLYDIDIIVNRTVVYGSLTAVLAATYLGLVVLLQQVLGPLASGSDLSVAASTLAVAALFRPLRRRVQGFIDRRFYRHKYDVALTLENFARTLRTDVDLDSLSADLIGVVASTMQPAHASLWLRASGAGQTR